MLEKIKNYLLLVAAAAISLLYFLLGREKEKSKELQLENSSLNIEKDLANVTKKAEESKSTYLDSKSEYDKFKSEHPELFK